MYRDGYSGAVVLEMQRTRKKLIFHKGAPVAAESKLASETLCALLVSEGRLSDPDVERVEQSMTRQGCEESSALMSLGLLESRELFKALKQLVRRRTISCFSWSQGSYALQPEDTPADDMHSFRADPLALVQAGLEAEWGVDRMLAALAPQMDRFPTATRAFSDAITRLDSDEATQALFEALDGSCSLGEILGGAVRSPRALAAAWVLDASELLRYHDTAIDPSKDAEAPSVEIEIAGVADTPQRNESDGPQAAQKPARDESAPPGGTRADEAEALRGEIQDRMEQLADLDFYQLLGIERDASTGAVKKAYIRAAKRYHPDTLARLGLDSVKQVAARVFSRVAEAYGVLRDAEKRAQYDSIDANDPEIDTTSLAQAETFFRKGEILVRMGDFRGALQFLENAVELWPEESAYQSTLGWSLYKKNPSEPLRAREHLEMAVGLAPKDAVAHFRMGIVLRALGEEQAALDSLSYAKQLDPSASEAR